MHVVVAAAAVVALWTKVCKPWLTDMAIGLASPVGLGAFVNIPYDSVLASGKCEGG